MTNAPRLSDRIGKLRQLQTARGLSALSPAAPLPGDWPAGCEAYQASFAQARLWFLHQLEPGLTAYHLPAVWKLRGDLDVPALQRALEGLIERHSTLRTSFLLQGSEVIQLVHFAAPFPIAGEALGERDPEDVIQGWLEEESRTPFDLTAGLLLRARLLLVDGQQHVLLINHHHIASDGWSRSVLARDLVEIYNAQVAGRLPQLEPLSIHYQDCSAWQRQRLSGGQLVELQDYWVEQLRGLEPLELPTDRARPAMPSHHGENVGFTIEPALLEPFEKLCREESATLQMGLLAVVALLLHRYSRQDDFAIGIPIWGRNHPDLERLIGFFINTVPIRMRFAPDQSFRELLAQVRASSIEAYDNQELPFEQIVEALGLPRDASRNPFYQVMMQVAEFPEDNLFQLEKLEAEKIPQNTASLFDLECNFRRIGQEGLRVRFIYSTDLFDATRLERLCSHFATLLQSVLRSPDAPAASLVLLPQQERDRIESWQRGCQGKVGKGTDWLGVAAPASRHRLRVCLIGDSSLAVQCAEILAARGHHLSVIVPTGRTLAQWAIDHGIPILHLDQEHLAAELALCSCDVLLSLSNDNILSADVLATAKHWAINLHDALLPRYAGLNAPTWALLHREQRHGVTWHRMTEGIDRGDVLLQADFAIPVDCDALGLQLLCIKEAVASFADLLSGLETGNLQSLPIDPAVERTYFGRYTRPPRAGVLDLSEPLTDTLAVIRGLSVDTEQSVLPPPLLPLGGTWVRVGQAAWIEASSDLPSLQVQEEALLLQRDGGALRLSSLCSLRGDLLTAADLQGQVNGEATPASSLRSQQRMLLENLDQRAARAESFWIDQFSRLDPAALALFPAPRDGATRQWITIPIPASLLQIPDRSSRDGTILALLAQAFDEVWGQPCSAMALLLEDEGLAQLERPWSELFSPWVPLSLHGGSDRLDRAQALASRFDQPALQVPFRWDLVGRKRALRERRELIAALPQGVLVCRGTRPDGLRDGRVLEDLAPALAIGLPGADGTGVQVGIDAVRIEPERAQALLKRWHQLLADDAVSSERPEQGPGAATPGLDPAAALLVRMGAIAAADPDRLALVDGSLRIGYGQLMDLATDLGVWIADFCGAGAEVVAVVADQRSDHILAMLACLVAKRAFVVLDSQAPPERLRQSLLALGGVPILANRSCRTAVGELAASFGEPLWFSLTSDRRLEVERPTVASDRNIWTSQPQWAGLAYVIFTSGSTGQPKPVAIERTALEAFACQVVEGYQLDQRDRVLQFAALTFDACIEEIFPSLAAGAAVFCRSEDVLTSATHFLRFLERNRITVVSLPTAFWADLIQECWRVDLAIPDSVRLVIVGGEELIVQHLRVWEAIRPAHTRLINTYGPTEATVGVAWLDLERSWPYRQSIPLGRPLPSAELRVLDPAGHPCPIGIPGELHIGGSGLARGYLNHADRTAASFIADPLASNPGARLYRSGDLVSWNPDGTLAFHGRIDQQIKLRGFRIEPAEIETLLLRHPAVAQAAVLLRRDDPLNPRLIAYWVPQAPGRSGASVAAAGEGLRSFLGERLPLYMMPAAFVELEALPLTTHGKLDRKALPAPSFTGDLQQRMEPSTDLERQLHAIWAEVLGHGEFGITDNFFAIGGHSLAAARLVSRIEQSLGSAPPLATLFQNPTIAGLAPLLVGSSGVAELSDRIGKLRQLQAARGLSALSPAAPLPGDWPAGCEAFPSSHAQARLWFLHQLEPGLTAYHLPALWRLTGALDVAALEQALGALIERHPTLRTSFQLRGREVVQIVHPAVPFALGAEALAARNPAAVIQEWLEQEQLTPFDLTDGQLLRALLLAVDDRHHLLLINHHHIASDGWSCSLLTRDLTELYNAHRSGRTAELPPLRGTYHDYAAWQRQRLSGDRLQTLKDYWIPQLTGLEPLELPSDHPRPATPSHRGARVDFQITPELLAPFEELCRLEGATLQMGLLALLALLLHRYSRQQDFAIGVPILGRNHPELENLIGFFINTLPVRTRFTPQQSFRQLLQQVKASSLAAYDHQELPFEQIVEALNLPRDTSRNPLVQVMLQLIELPEASLINLQGLAVESLEARNGAARFDLEFFLRRSPDGLKGEIAYATELFSTDRIERLCSHLLTLLSSALQAPDSPAASLCLLPDSERQLIESWQNGPTIDVPDLCVHQLFEQQVDRTPDAIALIFEDQQLTYSDLNARANQLGHHLIDLGVGPEVIVAVCLERSVELIVSLLAILKAGGAYLPLDPSWPEERHALLLKEAASSVLINQDGATVLEDLSPQGKGDPSSRLAYVTYTSGSTGKPKGVAISHQSILRLVDPVNGFLLSGGHRVLQLVPVAFDAATLEIWGPLLNGGTSVVAPPERPSLPALAALLKKHNITTVWLTAGLFHAMVEAELAALAGVQQVLAGGDVLSAEHVQRLLDAFPSGHELINGYGPTENTTFTCCHHFEAAATVDTTGVSIGRPIANTEVRVLDEGNQPCPIGIPGELHIGGAGLARGYLNNPELTAEKFIPDPFSSDPTARLYKSGDLASWNPDGTLAFHGRIDQQIKLRGFRIEPGEIEANLLSHPAVGQVAVLLSHDDHNNSRLIAYWVADASHETTAPASSEQLRSFLAERLPDYMVPAAFLQLEALPLTPNGKLDRKALPAPSFSGNLEQRVAPSSDLERQLHAIWAEVLGHGDFGISDNFFAVGGHSLAAASLVSRMEKAIGISISLAKLFQNPTISGLVDQLSDEKGEPQEDDLCCLVPLQPLGSRPPLFIVPGWGGGLVFEQGACLLAPHQPVYGLRIMGDPAGKGCKSFDIIISTFADLIVDFWRQGDICLMSYSIGGWYAHALAAELLRRGRRLGILVIVDTGPNYIRFSRSLGAMLLWDRLSQVRLRMLMRNLVREPTLEKRRAFLWGKMRTLKQAIEALTGLRIPRPGVGLSKTMPSRARPQTDFYVDLVRSSYRPCPLPIRVALLATPLTAQRYKRLWRHYATRDLQVFCCLDKHRDVLRPDVQSKLAPLIEDILIGQQDWSY